MPMVIYQPIKKTPHPSVKITDSLKPERSSAIKPCALQYDQMGSDADTHPINAHCEHPDLYLRKVVL